MTKNKTTKKKKKSKPKPWYGELFKWPWGWPEAVLAAIFIVVITYMIYVMDFGLKEFANQVATGVFFVLVVGIVVTWVEWLKKQAKKT